MDVILLELAVLFVAFVGLAGPALGLLGLLVRGNKGVAWHLAGLGFTAVLAAAALGAAAAGLPADVWGPALALAGVFGLVQVWQVGSVRHLTLSALAALKWPGLRWCVLLAACPLLAVWAGWRAESLGESASCEFHADNCLDRSGMYKAPVAAVTDAGRPVAVYRLPDATMADAGRLVSDRGLVAEWAGKLIRTGPADPACNCHGWVYAGGAYWVHENDVDAILTDNGYYVVAMPQPGDVVAYRDDKRLVTHSAVVRVVEPDAVLVEGKWGPLGRYLHRAEDQPYGRRFAYYRSSRKGHVLAGIGGPASPPAAESLEAE